MKIQLVFLLLISFFGHSLLAQQTQGLKQVAIEQAASLEKRQNLGPDVQVLKGKVIFSHEGSRMYCDSAYYYTNDNSLKAFGKIHINRGDSIHLYGDTLFYSGNLKAARVQTNVLLRNDSLSLRTPELTYYMQEDMGTYQKGGVTINKGDTLRSREGRYYAKKDMFHFNGRVRVNSTKMRITSDTLKHNTYTQISFFYGPTQIYGDSNYIYCENGWYNHKFNRAQFNKNARYQHKAYTLTGDSIFFDRGLGYGQAYRNITLHDSAQHVSISGNYAKYEEKTEKALVTNRAVFMQYDQKGDSLFLHADTLLNQKIRIGSDTIAKQFIYAFHHVRAWRHDLQLSCDSMIYLYQDSIIRLHGKPILWHEKHQMTADSIETFTQSSPERIELYNAAFIASQETELYFNQITGLNITALIENKSLTKIEVKKSGSVLYFLKEEEKFSGVNKAECDRILFFFQDKKLDGVLFPTKSKGTIFPIRKIEPADTYLPNFKWQDELRPKIKMIFLGEILLKTIKK